MDYGRLRWAKKMKYLVQPTYSMLDSHFALFSLPWGVFSSLRPCVWLRRQHVQQQVPASSCKLAGIFLCLYISVWKYPRKYLSILKYALGNDPISHWRKYALMHSEHWYCLAPSSLCMFAPIHEWLISGFVPFLCSHHCDQPGRV